MTRKQQYMKAHPKTNTKIRGHGLFNEVTRKMRDVMDGRIEGGLTLPALLITVLILLFRDAVVFMVASWSYFRNLLLPVLQKGY